MGFKVKEQPRYPRRLWSLVGYPGSGKSTFAAQMKPGILAIDADHRFDEVIHLVKGKVYELDSPADNVIASRIAGQLRLNMPDPAIGTIVVDSLTAIIAPLIGRAILDNAAGVNKNKSAAFIDKAVAMRLLQDTVTMFGTDVLWLYHLQDGRDNQGQKVVTTTIPATELSRLGRSLNARLRIVTDGDRRGVKVEWCRRGQQGMTLWDDTGSWAGMPEKLEEAMYAQNGAITPKSSRFTGPDQAITWAVDEGFFSDPDSARASYERIKTESQPATAGEMWELWTTACYELKGAAEEAGF